ncbi:MAG TPA: efflux RND transporter periplasmic adaptor subunit [Paludibacteraceae bacterium]|nr:efflux RND transporter periplasmic adaptor subunit [Paludibacteraceae bacterium]
MKTVKNAMLIFSVLVFVACDQTQKSDNSTTTTQESRVEQVQTSPLSKTTISRTIDLSTTLQGYETVNISPSLSGKIEHIFVEVGATVSKGQLLVRMDQNQYNTTKLTYANLGVELARMEALKESGAISQQTYDRTKLSYDQTKENMDFLERNTYIKAPFSGVIAAKNYEDGELYAGQPILVLTQINTLKAIINIPESNFPIIKKGQKVNLHSEIYPDKVFPATIEVVYPTIDATTHTFQVKLNIPNASLLLRPGMFVRTTLTLVKVDAIMAPYQAVLKLIGSNERYVFINENGIAKRVSVTLGQRFDDMVELLSSELSEGDDLVTLGQAKLVDGSKINVVNKN